MNERIGNVLRIEKTSIHDGSGLRSVVFLEGCPLSCKWCSTPESQIRCKSADYGKKMSVAQVVKEIRKDSIFFFHSGGGVTISGGEVLMQPEFASEILKECRYDGMETAIETSLFANYDNIKLLIPHLTSMFIDFKIFDREMHKRYTGVSNDIIKSNLEALQEDFGGDIHIRIPTIPGVNMNEENMKNTADFLKGLKRVKDIELLPYHRLGIESYRKLGIEYELPEVETPDAEEMAEMARYIIEADPDRKVIIKGVPFN